MNRFACILICLLIIGHEKPVSAQLLTPEQVLFLQHNAHPVYARESISNGNWSTIAGQLKNKRIFLIGEPNHGSREIFLLRNDLVRYLHEKMGFDVVLFE